MARSKKSAQADPDASSADLGSFEGLPVSGVAIIIPSVAGGLVEPMKVAPVVLHGGDEACITFRLRAGEIRHRPVYSKDDEEMVLSWTRVQRLDVLSATFVDEELVAEQLDEMERRVEERREADRLAKERAKGVQRLGGTEQLEADHGEGKHTELVEGCPSCDAEVAAADLEALSDEG